MEFQAIVLAAGQGSRMTELASSSNNTPKCLLPIGNKPMLWYPVRMLEKAGFKEINIITLASAKVRVETELKANGIKANLNIVCVDDKCVDDDDYGTARSLALLKEKITRDCMVVSDDLISNINVQSMANFYRITNAALVMLLADNVEQNCELPMIGAKGKYNPERDLIGLDEETNRVLYFNSQEDIEDEIELKTNILQKYPKITWTTKLQDSHFYIVKKWLIDYIIDNQKLVSFKSEFLPYLCRKQFSLHKRHLKNLEKNNQSYDTSKSNKAKPKLYDYIKLDEFSLLANKSDLTLSSINLDLLPVHAFIQADGFCLRANNVAIYAEANRQITGKIISHFVQRERTESLSKYDKSQIGADSMIGDGTLIGEKSLIKRSVLGRNCKIGDKVKINNSILMDNCEIGEGVSIQGSILCSNCKIIAKSELKDCLVGYNQDLTAGKYSNETVQDVGNFIDDDDDEDDDEDDSENGADDDRK